MRRHDSLIPLTHDHHHALVQVKRLRAAASGSGEQKGAAATGFLSFFHDDTIHHFREEEEVVFPLVVEVDELRDVLERVMMEHLVIHSLVGKLTHEAEASGPTSDTLGRIATTLEDHVRFEERVVFPAIEEHAGGAGLEGVALRPRQRTGPDGAD
jgi:iron-sulfur cluster repair protein YtfE (RIC family)